MTSAPTALDSFVGDRLYLDTNIFIYFVEGHARFAQTLIDLFRKIDAYEIAAFTSELTMAEVLVKPLAEGKAAVAAVYEQLFEPTSRLTAVPISREILRRSASLRASHPLKAFDAIHVATAVEMNCAFFLSEDKRVRSPGSLQVLPLTELCPETPE